MFHPVGDIQIRLLVFHARFNFSEAPFEMAFFALLLYSNFFYPTKTICHASQMNNFQHNINRQTNSNLTLANFQRRFFYFQNISTIVSTFIENNLLSKWHLKIDTTPDSMLIFLELHT